MGEPINDGGGAGARGAGGAWRGMADQPAPLVPVLRADARSWALVAALTAIWGSSFFLIAVALGGFGPVAVATGRVVFAALALGAALAVTGRRLPSGLRAWGWCGALGVVGLAAPFTLLAYAQQTVPSGVAAIYIAGVPLFLLALTRLVYRDPVTGMQWLGFAIGLGGIGWLAGPEALAGLARSGVAGQAACLGAAFCYACGALVVRSMPPLDPLGATAAAHLVAAGVLVPFGLADVPEAMPPLWPVLALAALGVVQTGLAQVLRFVAIRRAGPVFVSIVGYLIPIWAGFLGVMVLGEALGPATFGAYGVILLGLLVARGRG